MKELANTLELIKANDTNYDERYLLVFKAVYLALAKGIKAGIRSDIDEPEWPVVYIDLPTGQVSWHMPQHISEWDGHGIEEKYRRIDDFCRLYNSDCQKRVDDIKIISMV